MLRLPPLPPRIPGHDGGAQLHREAHRAGLVPGRIALSTGMDRSGGVVAGRLRLGPDQGVVPEEGTL
ncbi:MAG: hypothetical protein ABIJ48_03105 [Actinomycetota bacterium]